VEPVNRAWHRQRAVSGDDDDDDDDDDAHGKGVRGDCNG